MEYKIRIKYHLNNLIIESLSVILIKIENILIILKNKIYKFLEIAHSKVPTNQFIEKRIILLLKGLLLLFYKG